MPRARSTRVNTAIDTSFEPSDAFRATMPMAKVAPLSDAASPSRTVWWPIVLVGFVAVVCATIAFLKSPLAAHPKVAPYAQTLLAKLG